MGSAKTNKRDFPCECSLPYAHSLFLRKFFRIMKNSFIQVDMFAGWIMRMKIEN